jgi:transcriptional regulator with XRE-family HTH domain
VNSVDITKIREFYKYFVVEVVLHMFADVFTKLLEERGVTTYRLSKETGIPSAMISKWKNGHANPSATNLKKLADYFGVAMDELRGNGLATHVVAHDIHDSAFVQGTNNGTVVTLSRGKQKLTDEEVELLRIYNLLDVRTRHQLMAAAFEFEKTIFISGGDLLMSQRTNKLWEYIEDLKGDMDNKTLIEKIGTNLSPRSGTLGKFREGQEWADHIVGVLAGPDATKEIEIVASNLKLFCLDTQKGFAGNKKVKGYTEVAVLARESGWYFFAYDEKEIRKIFEQAEIAKKNGLLNSCKGIELCDYIRACSERLIEHNDKCIHNIEPSKILELAKEARLQPKDFTGILGDVSNEIAGNI